MLYIEEISLHNFKSFKSSSVRFEKGFNCIIGPNGSGKSSICDSILFALGEPSLRRMRVNTSTDLINSFAKQKSKEGVKKGSVTVKFNGDKKIEIEKSIDTNNTIIYRMDGKRASKQSIVDLLKAYKAEINNTNTMQQGEIIRVTDYNPKERRSLIDTAAGIKQFDEKKDAAMDELEKVDAKITEANVLLGERIGFLKELEKEKLEAEHYISLSQKSRLLNYALLKTREQELSKSFEQSAEKIKLNLDVIKQLQTKIYALDLEIESISKAKQDLTGRITKDSTETGIINKSISDLRTKIAINETQALTYSSDIKRVSERLSELEKESAQIIDKITKNNAQVSNLNISITDTSSKIKVKKQNADQKTNVALIKDYKDIDKNIEKLSSELMQISQDETRHLERINNLKSLLLEFESKINSVKDQSSHYLNQISSMRNKIDALDKELAQNNLKMQHEHAKIKEFENKISEIDSKILNVKESIAVSKSGSSIEINNILKSKLEKGFYGRAYELFTFDDKDMAAVYASAGNRLNYFVVDSIETANEAISILKSKSLGTASFIPINDVLIKQTPKIENAERIIDKISCDKKFEKAFDYIFSNTYIIKDFSFAKKIGLGLHRYVTSGGEVIEPSGIVSGGSFKLQKQYPQLETDLNKLNSMKTLTVQEIRNHNDALRQVASENSKKETEKLDVSIELKHLQSKIEELSHEQDELSATYKAKTIEYEKLAEASQSIADKRINIESNLKLMKENAMRIYSGIGNIVSNADEEKDAEMQEKLLAELQDMKMQVASLVKENEMYGTRAKQVDKEIQEASKNLHEIKIQLSKLKSDQASLIPQLAEMESKLKLKDKASAELFEQINEKDALISKVGIEKGKLQSNIERLSKENSEIDLNRQHTQIRLNDIKSELNILSTEDILKALSNVTGKQDVSLDIIRMEFLKKHFGINSQQELEIELSSVKKELEKINDVNLKAPEMFAQRQKDLNEIEQKLSTLKKEKDAVIEMINEIEGRKISIFNTVFESVNSNMKKLFSYVNTTEEVNLRIEKPSDPFNSGLFIETSKIGAKRPPKSIETLSGGEKALLLIILLLSIQIRNSLSFYLFDEIDVSLDKENSKKLSKIIKELSKSSQFIVVSHNDSLITEADIAIGVSKQNDESKAFGLQLSELRQQALAKSK